MRVRSTAARVTAMNRLSGCGCTTARTTSGAVAARSPSAALPKAVQWPSPGAALFAEGGAKSGGGKRAPGSSGAIGGKVGAAAEGATALSRAAGSRCPSADRAGTADEWLGAARPPSSPSSLAADAALGEAPEHAESSAATSAKDTRVQRCRPKGLRGSPPSQREGMRRPRVSAIRWRLSSRQRADVTSPERAALGRSVRRGCCAPPERRPGAESRSGPCRGGRTSDSSPAPRTRDRAAR